MMVSVRRVIRNVARVSRAVSETLAVSVIPFYLIASVGMLIYTRDIFLSIAVLAIGIALSIYYYFLTWVFTGVLLRCSIDGE